jgi:hypothetical protein
MHRMRAGLRPVRVSGQSASASGGLAREGEVFGTGQTTVGGLLDCVLEHGREHRGEIEAALI